MGIAYEFLNGLMKKMSESECERAKEKKINFLGTFNIELRSISVQLGMNESVCECNSL